MEDHGADIGEQETKDDAYEAPSWPSKLRVTESGGIYGQSDRESDATQKDQ